MQRPAPAGIGEKCKKGSLPGTPGVNPAELEGAATPIMQGKKQ
jgi:hypothetical protein